MAELRVISGLWRGRRIKIRTGGREEGPRPTADRVRTSLFDRLAPRLPGARVLDLFAGTGSLGIEALSRGADHATFVEKSAPTVRVLVENLKGLGLAPTGLALTGLVPLGPRRAVRTDAISSVAGESVEFTVSDSNATTDIRLEDVFRALAHLERVNAGFRIIFADPPYASRDAGRLVTRLDESPLLETDGMLIVEHDRRETLPAVSHRLEASDERRYGDTVLSFFHGR